VKATAMKVITVKVTAIFGEKGPRGAYIWTATNFWKVSCQKAEHPADSPEICCYPEISKCRYSRIALLRKSL